MDNSIYIAGPAQKVHTNIKEMIDHGMKPIMIRQYQVENASNRVVPEQPVRSGYA